MQKSLSNPNIFQNYSLSDPCMHKMVYFSAEKADSNRLKQKYELIKLIYDYCYCSLRQDSQRTMASEASDVIHQNC